MKKEVKEISQDVAREIFTNKTDYSDESMGRKQEVQLTNAEKADDLFVEPKEWHEAHNRYQGFIKKFQDKNMVFVELGVGMNTPGIIKYPFWQLTLRLKDAYYVCINKGEAWAPIEIKHRSLVINDDINEILASQDEKNGKRKLSCGKE